MACIIFAAGVAAPMIMANSKQGGKVKRKVKTGGNREMKKAGFILPETRFYCMG